MEYINHSENYTHISSHLVKIIKFLSAASYPTCQKMVIHFSSFRDQCWNIVIIILMRILQVSEICIKAKNEDEMAQK